MAGVEVTLVENVGDPEAVRDVIAGTLVPDIFGSHATNAEPEEMLAMLDETMATHARRAATNVVAALERKGYAIVRLP